MHRFITISLVALVACGGDDNAQPGDSGTDASADVTADVIPVGDDGPGPPSFNGRLFVATGVPTSGDGGAAGTVLVWDGLDTLTTAAAPTFSITGATTSTLGVAAAGDDLVIGPLGFGLTVFASAQTLGAGVTPVATLKGGLPSFDQLVYTASTNALWTTNATSATYRWDGASAFSASSKYGAIFTSSTQNDYGFAYDDTGDRAFLADTSSIVAFNGAKSATGTPAPDFTLDPTLSALALAVGQGRLYALSPAGSNAETIAVWNGISSVTGAKAPDFTLTGASAVGTVVSVTAAGTLLVVCNTYGPTLVWENATTLATSTAADFQLLTPGPGPRRAFIGQKTDRLYILDTEGVSIYGTASTNPTLVARLVTNATAHDLAVIE